MRRILSLLLFVCVSASCDTTVREQENVSGFDSGLVQVPFYIELDGEECVEVKSVLPEDIEYRITDMTLASYGHDGMLVDVKYHDHVTGAMPVLVDSESPSNIYVLVNMGDMSTSFPQYEQEVSEIEYHIRSYSEVEEKGFPMSGQLKAYLPHDSARVINVQRLFSKLSVRITHNSLSGYSPSTAFAYNLCNKGLYVRQANSRMLPFSVHGGFAVSYADTLDASDCHMNLNDRNAYQGSLTQSQMGPGPGYLQDTTVVLYVPENVQGKLLPHNKDPYGKVYGEIDDLGGRSYSELCTYLEFHARRENTRGYSGDVTYKYYLGADNTSDFSLERNKRYDITLDFTEEGFFADSWKVTRGDDWNDARMLLFTDEPYLVTPGGTVRLMVHYHRQGKLLADSQSYPDEWQFLVDENSMSLAGLSWSFDPSVLSDGDDGYKRFCVDVSADLDAVVGTVVPVKVISSDGSVSDESYVTVVGRTDFSLVWNNRPEYVSQEGVMSVTGVDESDLPLTVSLSDASKVSCVGVGAGTYRIVAHRTGSVELRISNASGTKVAVAALNIKAPELVTDVTSIVLEPDGESVVLGYRYVDEKGRTLGNVNASAYDTFLKPIVDADSYFDATVTSSFITMCITSLGTSHDLIRLGKYYDAMISAAECPDVIPKNIRVLVKNLFEGITVRDYGRIDDYTLFMLAGVNPRLSEFFADELQANTSFSYPGFMPEVEAEYVSVELEPLWTGGFSGPNEIFEPSLDYKTGTITVKRKSAYSTASHSAGRHRMMVYVMNRHSGERIGEPCGELDLYVHTALGARAVFGSRECGWSPYGNETFASVYNKVAGRVVYPSISSNSLICYMDVYLEWMTDVSKVYVWDRMNRAVQSGADWMDALGIVRPSVADGELNSNTRMLYSVMEGRDSRISVCDEKYGPRKGIGCVLYRALLQPTYGTALTDIDLKRFFMGYESVTGAATAILAPCYTLHDLNKGPDMQVNKIWQKVPYYFSPSSCPSFVDDQGRGYHVIHFLEEISPDTFGWINLF